MPVVSSSYVPPPLLSGGHVQTLFASIARRVAFSYDRSERIETPDEDFLDLHWAAAGANGESDRVAVLTHGLEGSASRPYMRGMARALVQRGWDVCAWNLRGCGSELNRCAASYHSGKTEDLACVVNHVLARGYAAMALVGFSLGGNLTLKYLGERGEELDARVRGGVAISAPVDLKASSQQIGRPTNWHYTTYFLWSLRQKIRRKAKRHPETVCPEALSDVRTLRDFDDAYTAPLNGFRDADAYYRSASSKTHLTEISVPTLLISAADDPFLCDSCYPIDRLADHPHVALEVPESGGHVGFVSFNEGGTYWSERRATSFLGSTVSSYRRRRENERASAR